MKDSNNEIFEENNIYKGEYITEICNDEFLYNNNTENNNIFNNINNDYDK